MKGLWIAYWGAGVGIFSFSTSVGLAQILFASLSILFLWADWNQWAKGWPVIFAQTWSWQHNWVLSLDRQTAEPPKHLHSELLQSNWLVSLISETTQTSASTFSLICSVVLSVCTVCKNHRPLSIDASRYQSSRIFLASAVSTAELAHGPWN